MRSERSGYGIEQKIIRYTLLGLLFVVAAGVALATINAGLAAS